MRIQTIDEVINNLLPNDCRRDTWGARKEMIRDGEYRRVLQCTLYDVAGNGDERMSIAIVCQAIAEDAKTRKHDERFA